MESEIIALLAKYGFPAVASLGLGYCIYNFWLWVVALRDTQIANLKNQLIQTVIAARGLNNKADDVADTIDTAIMISSKK